MAYRVLEIDSEITWLLHEINANDENSDTKDLAKQLEILKQQKIDLYEDSCNRF